MNMNKDRLQTEVREARQAGKIFVIFASLSEAGV